MRWLAATVLMAMLAAGSEAATLQALLIRASQNAPTDAALKEVVPQLKQQFGFNHYRVIGSKHDALRPKTKQTFDIGEGFSVVATLRSTTNNIHELDIQWLAGKTQLLATKVKMTENSHVFVRGPAVGNDWIVLSLTILP